MEAYRRKFLLSLVLSPLALVPFMAGASVAVLFAALGNLAAAGFSVVAGFLISTGVAVSRFVFAGESIAKDVEAEIESEDFQKREAVLNDLEEQLETFGDTISERAITAFRDLRTLLRTFKESKSWRESVDAITAGGITKTVDEIFKQCVSSLQSSIDLLKTASGLGTRKARSSILRRREEIVDSVEASVNHLADTVSQLQSIGGNAVSTQDEKLSGLGEELKRQLEVARAVDERMKSEFGSLTSREKE